MGTPGTPVWLTYLVKWLFQTTFHTQQVLALFTQNSCSLFVDLENMHLICAFPLGRMCLLRKSHHFLTETKPVFCFVFFFVFWSFCLFFFFFFFVFSRAAPVAYGGSQARGLIRAVAAGLHHSHSNAESEPHLRPTPQLTATLDPEQARDQTHNLIVPSQIC